MDIAIAQIIVLDFMMKALNVLVFSILTLSCDDSREITLINDLSIKDCDSLLYPKSTSTGLKFDLKTTTEKLKLHSGSTADKGTISCSLNKLKKYTDFNISMVSSIDHQKSAKLDLSSNKIANSFKKRLNEGFSADSSNFAGHYSFVYWGCGSYCQSSLLIDRTTGQIYDAPGAILGYDFRVDSKVLVVNPSQIRDLYNDMFWCKTIIYLFNEQKKSFEEIKPELASRNRLN